jgi:hypothetical protein
MAYYLANSARQTITMHEHLLFAMYLARLNNAPFSQCAGDTRRFGAWNARSVGLAWKPRDEIPQTTGFEAEIPRLDQLLLDTPRPVHKWKMIPTS